MADRRHEFRFKPVHFNLVRNITEDGYRAEEFIAPDDRSQMHQHHMAGLQGQLFGIGIARLVGGGVFRPGMNGLHPGLRGFAKQANKIIQRLTVYLAAIQIHYPLGRRIQEGDLIVGIRYQHTIGNGFQNGVLAAGFHLLVAQHGSQSFGLVADEVVQLRIVNGNRHLVTNGLHQIHGLRGEISHLAMKH